MKSLNKVSKTAPNLKKTSPVLKNEMPARSNAGGAVRGLARAAAVGGALGAAGKALGKKIGIRKKLPTLPKKPFNQFGVKKMLKGIKYGE